MTASEQRLRTKIEQFRSKKEVIKAQYSAAEAQVRISEAATGVGEEMADVGLAMQRALDKTEQMKARASAVQELEAAGTFEDLTTLDAGEDDIDRQLKAAVEHERGRRRAGEDEGRARDRAAAGARRRAGQRARRGRPLRRSSGAGAPVADADEPAGAEGAETSQMIVRIATEGQYELDARARPRSSTARQRRGRGLRGGRRGAASTRRTIACWRSCARTGAPLAADELVGSDVILPPPDVTFEEARAEFTARACCPPDREGLLPASPPDREGGLLPA